MALNLNNHTALNLNNHMVFNNLMVLSNPMDQLIKLDLEILKQFLTREMGTLIDLEFQSKKISLEIIFILNMMDIKHLILMIRTVNIRQLLLINLACQWDIQQDPVVRLMQIRWDWFKMSKFKHSEFFKNSLQKVDQAEINKKKWWDSLNCREHNLITKLNPLENICWTLWEICKKCKNQWNHKWLEVQDQVFQEELKFLIKLLKAQNIMITLKLFLMKGLDRMNTEWNKEYPLTNQKLITNLILEQEKIR